MIKSRRVRYGGACSMHVGERKYTYKTWAENMKGAALLGELGTDWKIMLEHLKGVLFGVH
jgi:hypothetical protein